MTSETTLELDHDAVRLLRRGKDGEAELGRVPLGENDFADRLATVRHRAGTGPVEVSLLLPPSLVLFFDAGDAEGAELEARIARRTSCPVDELVVGRSGGLAAAVERMTLEEARDFAIAHGFKPVSYSARRKRDEGKVSFRIESLPLTFRSNRPQPVDDAAAEADKSPGTPVSAAPTATPARKPAEPPTRAPTSSGGASAPRTLAGTTPAGADPVPALVRPPVIAARSEEEALTIFGARDRAPRSRGLTPLHAAAAILAAAVLLASYGLFTGELEDMEIVGAEAAVENTLDPILEGQTEAQGAVAAPAPDPETRQQPEPRQTADQPAPRIDHETVALDSPRATPAPVPSLPPEATPSEATDLTALAPPPGPAVEVPVAFTRPPPPGTVFDMDERGLVRPSEDGAPTPQGVLVYSGPPAVLPPDRSSDAPARPPPGEVTSVEPAPQVAGIEDDASLAAPQEGPPAAGPDIVRLRPEARPEAESPDIVVVAEPADEDTPRPRDRPAGVEQVTVTSAGPAAAPDFDALARQARTETAAAATGLSATRAAEPPREAPVGEANVAVEPTLPTRASVADRATLDNAIRLDRMNLIGVYGSPSDRRALIRLPTGRYLKVKVGDRVDGGRVAAIEASSLEYVKGGQRYALTMPNG